LKARVSLLIDGIVITLSSHFTMSAPIQMMWVEGPLSALERLSMQSFLRCGHPVHLYVYHQVSGIPDGVTVLDGRSILPESRICRYGPAAGKGAGSLALFANLFRVVLLDQRGGIWSDCDMVCLKPLDDVMRADYVFATEYRDPTRGIVMANNCFMKAPAGSPFTAACASITLSADMDNMPWGQLGPTMVTALVREHVLERFLAPPWMFSPLGFWEFRRLVDDTPLALNEATFTMHCFNEMWRRNGLDKNARYGARSPYEWLKAKFGTAAEAVPQASDDAASEHRNANGTPGLGSRKE
jgi:hypothetical protein